MSNLLAAAAMVVMVEGGGWSVGRGRDGGGGRGCVMSKAGERDIMQRV